MIFRYNFDDFSSFTLHIKRKSLYNILGKGKKIRNKVPHELLSILVQAEGYSAYWFRQKDM